MARANQITTIQDLEKFYYPNKQSYFLNKADDPWTSGSTGAYNPIYGQFVWMLINMEANFFGVLPKVPWDNSGVRVVNARAPDIVGTNIDAFGGTPDGGVIADSVKPSMAVWDSKPKLMQFAFEVGYVQERLVTLAKDDNWGNLSQLRMWGGVQFKEKLNRALAADEEDLATGAGTARPALNRFESLDVVIASKAERDVIIAGQNDWYDPNITGVIDRDGTTIYDSYVKSAGTMASVNGTITDDLLRGVPMAMHERSGSFPTVAITSETTMNEIEGQYNNQIQYNILGESLVQMDVNGIQTFNGHGVAMHVVSVQGIPYIVSKDAPKDKDDATEIGRILFLDTSDHEGSGKPRICLEILEPVIYREFSSNTAGFPFGTGKFGEEGLYSILGDLRCRHPVAQGKIRDIKI